jgi:hypothetical protein
MIAVDEKVLPRNPETSVATMPGWAGETILDKDQQRQQIWSMAMIRD